MVTLRPTHLALHTAAKLPERDPMTPYAKRIAIRAALVDSLHLALDLPVYDRLVVFSIEQAIETLEESIGIDEISMDALEKGGEA